MSITCVCCGWGILRAHLIIRVSVTPWLLKLLFKAIVSRLQEHALPPALLEDARDARNRESHGAESALGLPQRTSLWSGTGMTASPLTPEPTRAHAGGQPEPAEPWGSAPPFQEQVLAIMRVCGGDRATFKCVVLKCVDKPCEELSFFQKRLNGVPCREVYSLA